MKILKRIDNRGGLPSIEKRWRDSYNNSTSHRRSSAFSSSFKNPRSLPLRRRLPSLSPSPRNNSRENSLLSKHSTTVRHTKMSSLAVVPSSPKRSHSGDDDALAVKKQKLSHSGVEDLFNHCHSKANSAASTGRDNAAYARRLKVTSYAEAIRKKRRLARSVSSQWELMPTSAQKGMRNLTGALCYRHSLLQAIVHSPKVLQWLRTYHSPDQCVADNHALCIPCNLRTLVQAYWMGGRKELTLALSGINTAFKTTGWRVDVASGHGDPEEHLAWIQEQLESQLPSPVFAFFEAFHGLVLSSSIPCSKCGFISVTRSHAVGPLSIPIQPRIHKGNLSAYLSKYMDEVVEGYRCNSCGDASTIKHRVQTIDHSPDTIVIQFKRFDWSGHKDVHPVPFSPVLDLNPYRAQGNRTHSVYSLSAVISQSGSLRGGHYRCVAKGADNNWLAFDDENVSRASVLDAVNPGGKGGRVASAWSPYLLFFQRLEK